MDRVALRATFEEVPELYDRARPTYPDPLFDDLVALIGDRPRRAKPGPASPSPSPRHGGLRLLEIGPGTGKATVALAARGFEVTAVELGERLAAVARRNVPDATIVTADFEAWEPDASFDAIVAFTAFHWIDPALRYVKSARLLRPDGLLAVVETQHVLPPDGDPFFAEVQADYDEVDPRPDNRPPPPPDEVAALEADFAASGLFEPAQVRRYVWDVVYSADEYVNVLDTYSGHRALPEEKRNRLHDLIRKRIGANTIRKTYLATLTAANRRS